MPMWQSQADTIHYSTAYFEKSTDLPNLMKSWVYSCYIDVPGPHAFTQSMYEPCCNTTALWMQQFGGTCTEINKSFKDFLHASTHTSKFSCLSCKPTLALTQGNTVCGSIVIWNVPVLVSCEYCIIIGVGTGGGGTGGMCPPKFSVCSMPTLYVLYYKYLLCPPIKKSFLHLWLSTRYVYVVACYFSWLLISPLECIKVVR